MTDPFPHNPSGGAEASWQLFFNKAVYVATRGQAEALCKLVPGWEDLDADVQEAVINEVLFIEGLTAAKILEVILQHARMRAEHPSKLLRRPSVLWDYEGLERALNQVLLALIARVSLGLEFLNRPQGVREKLWWTWRQMLKGKTYHGKKTNELWRLCVNHCLPQWSSGRKNQPDNRRLQRRNPFNPLGKPHRSPLGEEW